MAKRKPQINFQVDESMKLLYEEAKAAGHWVTRFCAAGFLAMVENPQARADAITRLREWEAEFTDAKPEAVRAFVEGIRDAQLRGMRGIRPIRTVKPPKK